MSLDTDVYVPLRRLAREAQRPAEDLAAEFVRDSVRQVGSHPDDRELTKRATAQLQAAGEFEPRLFGRVLWVWHYPAFEAWRSWTVFSGGGPRAVVRELVWDQIRDREGFANPMAHVANLHRRLPTFQLRDRRVPWDELSALIEAGRGHSISLPGESGAGLDGEEYGVAFGSYMAGARVQWWCNGPPEWRPFTEWVARLRSYLAASESGE